MIKKLQDYIANCPDTVPSLAGFGLVVGVTSKTLHEWKSWEISELDQEKYPRFAEFRYMLERLNQHQEQCALNAGATSDWSPVIAKLVLAKHGYTDKVSVEHDLSDQAKQMMGWFDERKQVDSTVVQPLLGGNDE